MRHKADFLWLLIIYWFLRFLVFTCAQCALYIESMHTKRNSSIRGRWFIYTYGFHHRIRDPCFFYLWSRECFCFSQQLERSSHRHRAPFSLARILRIVLNFVFTWTQTRQNMEEIRVYLNGRHLRPVGSTFQKAFLKHTKDLVRRSVWYAR